MGMRKRNGSKVAGPTPAEPGHRLGALMARAEDSRSEPWNTLV